MHAGMDTELHQSRRDVLKKTVVAGGILWAAPVVDSFISPLAASSHQTTTTAGLNKWTNGNNAQPALSVLCVNGSIANAGRGSVTFTRDSDTNTISATVTLSTGTNVTGRFMSILQSTGCNAGTPNCSESSIDSGTWVATNNNGQWAATPQQGPQTFTDTIIPGATCFVLLMSVSGGGGNEDYATVGPIYLP